MLVMFPVDQHERYEANTKISEQGQWYCTKHSFTEGNDEYQPPPTQASE
jgi:hypothetical protein